MTITRDEAERRSRLPDVIADAERWGSRFCDIDRSLVLHKQSETTEPFGEWEWPRRLAVLRIGRQPRTP